MKIPDKIAVIGGGIAGCSTAYALSQRGIHVTLYERAHAVAQGASGNPLGMLYPRLSGENALSQYALAAYLYSLEFYKSLSLTKETFMQTGMLQLGFNARELARINKVAKSTISPTTAQLVSVDDASNLAGIQCHHPALHFPMSAWIKPNVVCQTLINQPMITRKLYQEVKAIEKNDEHFIVKTSADIQTFDRVVIANANEAKAFDQCAHLKFTKVRGQLTQLKASPTSQQLKTIICSDGYLSPAIHDTHTLGATFDLDNNNPNIDDKSHLENLRKMQVISPTLYESLSSKIIGGRTAFRCVSNDQQPMVGELLDHEQLKMQPPRPNAHTCTLPWIKGLYVNIAHGSHGLMSAPFCAELLSKLICHEPLNTHSELLSHLNPNRFLLKHLGLKKLAKTIASSQTN